MVRRRIRITLCDHGTLLASRDPVAIDDARAAHPRGIAKGAKLPPIGAHAAHIGIAAQIGLGNSDPALIKVRNVEP